MQALKSVGGLTLSFLLFFFLLRLTIAILIGYLLNNSNRRKRRKGQSFLDWLFYRRYSDVIPKSFKVWYYSLFIVYVVFSIVTIILDSVGMDDVIVRIPLAIYFFGYQIPYIATFLSWGGLKGEVEPGKAHTRKKRNKK